MTRPNSQPRFSLDESIYLRASAEVGFLESYLVSNVQYNRRSSQWVYQISLAEGGLRQAPFTIGDKVNLKFSRDLYFSENELVTMCEAALMVRTSLERKLAKIQGVIDTYGCGT
jgi:hypothetical protein